MLNLKKMQN